MPFFQNVFNEDFIGHLLLEDRQYVLDFKVPTNTNNMQQSAAWALPPYNTVGNNVLTFNYSIDSGKTWYSFSVTLTSGSAQTPDQVAADLNGNSNFSSLFIASVTQGQTARVLTIQSSLNRIQFRFYISNTSAETILRFNAKAGVAQLPSYFSRHTVQNFQLHGPGGDNTYPDSLGLLIQLTQPTDNWYITNAGLSTSTLADWQILRGRSRAFMFQNIATDAGNNNRITSIIEYPAGALAGDLAKKIEYIYSGGNSSSQPNYQFEIPYILQSSDLTTVPS